MKQLLMDITKDIEVNVDFNYDAQIISFNNWKGTPAIWDKTWHEAYVLRRDGQVIHLQRMYKNTPLPIHLEMVELGTDNYVIVYRIDNKFGEYGFIEV